MVCVSTDQTDCQHPQQKTCFIKCACDVPEKPTNMHTKTERRKNTSLLLVFFDFRWAVHHPCSGALRHTCFSVSHNKTSKACSGALRHTCFLVSREKPSTPPSLSGRGFPVFAGSSISSRTLRRTAPARLGECPHSHPNAQARRPKRSDNCEKHPPHLFLDHRPNIF